MIKVYFLAIEYDAATNAEKVKGIDYIHNAVLLCTEKPDVRKLIMDITPDEDIALSAVSIEVREATKAEQGKLIVAKAMMPTTPTRDLAAELDVIKEEIEGINAKLLPM